MVLSFDLERAELPVELISQAEHPQGKYIWSGSNADCRLMIV